MMRSLSACFATPILLLLSALFVCRVQGGTVPCTITTYVGSGTCLFSNRVILADFTTCHNPNAGPNPSNQISLKQIPDTGGGCSMKVYTGRDCVTEFAGYAPRLCSTTCTTFRPPGATEVFSCRLDNPTGAPTSAPTVRNNVTSGAATKSVIVALYVVIFVTPWSWFKSGGK